MEAASRGSSQRARSAIAMLFAAGAAVAAEQWSYDELVDNMRGTKTFVAQINSTTRLRDAAGRQVALTIVVRRPQESKSDDVMLVARNSQFSCGVRDCVATVKFGQEQPKKYALTRAADMSTHALFIEKADDFVGRARKVDAAIVEVDIFRHGRQQFSFDLPPLKLPDRPVQKK